METGLSYEKFKQLFVTTLGTQIQMKESLMWSVNPKKMVKEKGMAMHSTTFGHVSKRKRRRRKKTYNYFPARV